MLVHGSNNLQNVDPAVPLRLASAVERKLTRLQLQDETVGVVSLMHWFAR